MDWRPFFCGICFGIYPILANRSKLSSGATLSILSVVMIVFAMSPFLQNGLASIKIATSHQILWMVVSALASVIGLLAMFSYLADTPVEKAGTLVIIMVVVQIVATYATASSFAGTMPNGRSVLGVLAAIAAVLLLKA
jgi:uncharacterized membrane protein